MPHPNEGGTAARNTDFSLWAALSTSFAFSNLAQNRTYRIEAEPPRHLRIPDLRRRGHRESLSPAALPPSHHGSHLPPACLQLPKKRAHKPQPGSRGQPAPRAYPQQRPLGDTPGTSGQNHGYSTGTHPKPQEHRAELGTRVTLWYAAVTQGLVEQVL